jgi:hypothetical protein
MTDDPADGRRGFFTIGRSRAFSRASRSEIASKINLPYAPGESTETLLLDDEAIPPCAGDSGAWVIVPDTESVEPAVAGVLVGGNKFNEWSYMTPMCVVVADIEARLGCRVSFDDV